MEVGKASAGIPGIGAITWEQISRAQLDANLERPVTDLYRDKPHPMATVEHIKILHRCKQLVLKNPFQDVYHVAGR